MSTFSLFNILAHFAQNKIQLLIDSNVSKVLTFVVNTWSYGSNLTEPKHKYLSSIMFHFFFLLCTFFHVSWSFIIGIFCRPISIMCMRLSLKRKIHKIHRSISTWQAEGQCKQMLDLWCMPCGGFLQWQRLCEVLSSWC